MYLIWLIIWTILGNWRGDTWLSDRRSSGRGHPCRHDCCRGRRVLHDLPTLQAHWERQEHAAGKDQAPGEGAEQDRDAAVPPRTVQDRQEDAHAQQRAGTVLPCHRDVHRCQPRSYWTTPFSVGTVDDHEWCYGYIREADNKIQCDKDWLYRYDTIPF